jgi:capsular exopolysaccharide synthesis family protein
VLVRRWPVVLATLLASLLIALLLSTREHKEYSSTASLLFRDPGFAQALYGNGLFSNGQQEPQRTTQTEIDVVTSANVASVAANLLHTKESTTGLLESIEVTPASNADIATIKATRPAPREAAAVANAFAEAYIIYRRQTDRATVAQAEELVSQSLQTASPAEQAKLAESLRQLGVLRALQTGDAELIARAEPNGHPVSPKPKRDALLGLIVGLLLGSGLALLVDFLDRRLKTIDDFERIAPDWPVLAVVPRSPGGPVPSSLAGPIGEAYRMLREGLRFLDPTGRSRCFVITSAVESEGKSTVALNLACALAAIGHRVVLVEADMRRPTAARMLGVTRGAHGLSDMLISDDDVSSYLLDVEDQPGLSVIPSGTLPPNSADLLSAGRTGEVLAYLREVANYVIIDSPPLLPVADTRVMLRLPEVDGLIMVGRAGVTRRDRLRAASRLLAQSASRVFGLVITDVRERSSDYYYSSAETPEEETAGQATRRPYGRSRRAEPASRPPSRRAEAEPRRERPARAPADVSVEREESTEVGSDGAATRPLGPTRL